MPIAYSTAACRAHDLLVEHLEQLAHVERQAEQAPYQLAYDNPKDIEELTPPVAAHVLSQGDQRVPTLRCHDIWTCWLAHAEGAGRSTARMQVDQGLP